MKKCPICEKKYDARGMSSHKGSDGCYADVEGEDIGQTTYVEKKHPKTICIICAEFIEDDEKAIRTSVNRDSWGNISRINYMHLNHLNDEEIENLMAEAL